MLRSVLAVGTSAVGAQGLAAVTALLLVHWLTIADYALYVIFITVVGAVSVLTNAGLAPAMNSLIGRYWPDLRRVAWAIHAVSRARLMLSVIALPPLVAVGAYLFNKNNAGPGLIILLLVCLLVSWWGEVRSRVLDQALFHVDQAVRVQLLDVALAVLRLGLIFGAYQLGLLSLVVACAIGALMSCLRVVPITIWRKRSFPLLPHADPETGRAEEGKDLRTIRGIILRQLPVEVMYVLQPPVLIWVITIYLSSRQVAEFGALGRIAQLTLPLNALIAAFIIPRFARQARHVARTFLVWLGLLLVPAVGLVLACLAFPGAILSLLGDKYAGLDTELVWTAVNISVMILAGTAWQMLANRGFNRWAWTQIPVSAGWAVSYPLLWPVQTLTDVLIYQLGFALPLLVNVLLESRRGLADRQPDLLEIVEP